MTMTYCRSCQQDVHITHSADECVVDNPDVRTPDEVRAAAQEPRDEPEDTG